MLSQSIFYPKDEYKGLEETTNNINLGPLPPSDDSTLIQTLKPKKKKLKKKKEQDEEDFSDIIL